ncbi:hypothetical protein [Streptomyces antimycoticus]|uniref:hypothetical protein n=1 Tax=Streptomyces antimycoticus TaxID=68175 RepID=UPI000A39F34D|nr:hypothetical protein [Streptomyces antimycoticus]
MTNATQKNRIIEIARARGTTERAPATLQNPDVPEVLGAWLGAELHQFQPQTVVLWNDTAAAVFGHVVARVLGARVVYAFADQGVLTLDGDVHAGERVALVGYDWPERPGLDPLVRLVNNSGAVVAAVGSVLATQHAEVPVVVLDAGASR